MLHTQKLKDRMHVSKRIFYNVTVYTVFFKTVNNFEKLKFQPKNKDFDGKAPSLLCYILNTM